MYDKEKVIGWALGEVGYHESPNNWNKYAEHLDSIPGFYNGPKQNQMWCDVFVDDGFVVCYGAEAAKKLLCQPDYSCGAGCLYSMQYFQQAGQFHTRCPEPGDQIFFSYRAGEVSHTGIVIDVTESTVSTVEGNKSDCVQWVVYSINDTRILGYGRPDWNIGGEDPEPEPTPEPQPQPTPTPDYHYHSYQYTIKLHLLKRGDHGPQVASMQAQLNAKGFPCEADGWFGDETRDALITFQGTVGIAVDGEYGGESMNALLNY